MAKRATQEDRVLNHLKESGSITSITAIELYGVTRLSAVIYNLRRMGYPIGLKFETGKNRFGDAVKWGVYTLSESSKK